MKFEIIQKIINKIEEKCKHGSALGSAFDTNILKCTRFIDYDRMSDRYCFRINDKLTAYFIKYYDIKYYETITPDYYISFIKDGIEVCRYRTSAELERLQVEELFNKLQTIHENQLDILLGDFLNE